LAQRRFDPDDVTALQMTAEYLATAAQEQRWGDVYTYAAQITRIFDSFDPAPAKGRER
jgi:hypothetical protein